MARGMLCPSRTGERHDRHPTPDRTAGHRCTGILPPPSLLALRGSAAVSDEYTIIDRPLPRARYSRVADLPPGALGAARQSVPSGFRVRTGDAGVATATGCGVLQGGPF